MSGPLIVRNLAVAVGLLPAVAGQERPETETIRIPPAAVSSPEPEAVPVLAGGLPAVPVQEADEATLPCSDDELVRLWKARLLPYVPPEPDSPVWAESERVAAILKVHPPHKEFQIVERFGLLADAGLVFSARIYPDVAQEMESVYEKWKNETMRGRSADPRSGQYSNIPQESLTDEERAAIQLYQAYDDFITPWRNDFTVRSALLKELQKRDDRFESTVDDRWSFEILKDLTGGRIGPTVLQETAWDNSMVAARELENGSLEYFVMLCAGRLEEPAGIPDGLNNMHRTNLHEQIHVLLGLFELENYKHTFSDPSSGQEIIPVFVELMAMVESFHRQQLARDLAYNWREHPTGIVLNLPRSELRIDEAYAWLKDAGLLQHESLVPLLQSLCGPDGQRYFARLIYGQEEVPSVADVLADRWRGSLEPYQCKE